jgi:methylmalonyl-CoA mutase N-terminal domain/subunit
VIVGVNRFADNDDQPSIPAPDYSALEQAQVRNVKDLRKNRDLGAVKRSLEALRDAASPNSGQLHLMPFIIESVRGRATVGEISETLAANWGLYRPSL